MGLFVYSCIGLVTYILLFALTINTVVNSGKQMIRLAGNTSSTAYPWLVSLHDLLSYKHHPFPPRDVTPASRI